MAQPHILTGADLSIYINGAPFGIASELRWTIRNNRKAIYGIDNETPFEIPTGQRIIEGTINCYYLRSSGGLEGIGVLADGGDIIFEKYCTLVVVDRVTGDVVLSVQKMSAGDQSWSSAPKQLVTGNFAFMGIPSK